MADIQYLNYGDLQIELLALLNNLANEVQGYVAKLPWSNKRKEKFMSAYTDLMNRGIKGASNSTGLWVLDVNGDPLPWDSMDKKDKEMYQEAAYFIQQLMSGLPTKSAEEEKEEEKKKDLPTFDNFQDNFINYISKLHFGNNKIRIGQGEEDDWNYLDERDTNGIRGTKNRAAKLAQYLLEYLNSLKEGDYNFENTPYANLDDLKNRIGTAILALNDGTIDQLDTDALNAIGIRTSDWFNNGSGDYTTDEQGNQITYADLAKRKLTLAEEKAKLDKLNQYNNTLFFTRGSNKFSGKNVQYLKEKYLTNEGLLSALLNYSLKSLNSLTPDEYSEIYGAYKYLAKDPIDNNLLKQLLSSSSGLYKNASPNRFKKINGIDGYIWDSAANQVIQIQNREQYNASKNAPKDLFQGVLTNKEKQDNYFRNPEDGFTAADKRELWGIGLDLGSMFDPTRVLGTAAGLTASGLRTYNRWNDADGMTLKDIGASIFDFGLNGILWIHGVGNIVSGVKGVKNLAKFAPQIGRLIARAGAWGGTIYGISGLPEVWNKIDFAHPIDTAKRMTVEDWRKLGALIAGITGHRQLNVSNRGARKVLKQNGIEVSNKWHEKVGLTRTEVLGETPTPTLRMKIGENDVDIPIDKEVQQNLSKKLNKLGNDLEARSKVTREDSKVLKAAEKAGVKIKDENGNFTKEWKEATIKYDPSWRDKNLGGRSLPSFMRPTLETFGTQFTLTSNIANLERFNEYLQTRGTLDKIIYGSNRSLRRFNDNFLKEGIYGVNPKSDENPVLESTSQPKELVLPSEHSREPQFRRAVINRYKKTILNRGENGKTPTERFSNRDIVEGTYNINKETILVKKLDNGFYDIFVNGTKTNTFKDLSKKELKELIAKIILDTRKSVNKNSKEKMSLKEVGKILLDLKKKGWLQKGGRITDSQIDNFLKQHK